jgi:hypothetical protein
MPKYLLSWEQSHWMNVEVEADNEQHALDKFDDMDYDWDMVEEVDWRPIPDTLTVEAL